ncbi:glycosyltransferase [Litoribacterium kuwaitense]|uniref:glycosyltransferase n=1 Tax=Litoribacterium kuwaitense TaxID=1398745 RepID=UPI0035E41EE8
MLYLHKILDDPTKKDVLNQYKNNKAIKIFNHDINKGFSAARNTCITHFNGQYYCVVQNKRSRMKKC